MAKAKTLKDYLLIGGVEGRSFDGWLCGNKPSLVDCYEKNGDPCRFYTVTDITLNGDIEIKSAVTGVRLGETNLTNRLNDSEVHISVIEIKKCEYLQRIGKLDILKVIGEESYD